MCIRDSIRGLSPYPTAYTMLQKAEDKPVQMKIFASRVAECPEGLEPGTVLSDGKSYLHIVTQSGAISVTDLQLSGKKRMAVGDFLRGFREPELWKALSGTSRSEIQRLTNK